MKTYLVGGAVRDRLLGLPVKERDWVVVGATEDEMLAAGFKRADADFPVFLHPQSDEEYALARTETKTGPGYKGFAVEAGPDVTLEQDLARRDLTINALAEDEDGQLIDLFQGRNDLKARRLRHITPAFIEDPVRLLRVARFAARLGGLGFQLAPETLELMRQMAHSEDLQALKPERVWQEMQKALGEPQPWCFFEVLHHSGALAGLIPGLDRIVMDALAALRHATALSDKPSVRFAALFYPVMAQGADAAGFCARLRAERDYGELLALVVRCGRSFAVAERLDAAALLAVLEQVRAFQQAERFQDFLKTCSALWPDRAAGAVKCWEKALNAAKGVETKVLLNEGFSGPGLGEELARRRIRAIQNTLQ